MTKIKDAWVGILLCQGKIGFNEGHRHSEITQRDKNQEFKNTYLIIKKSSNLDEFSHSHPVDILKGKLLPERETSFRFEEKFSWSYFWSQYSTRNQFRVLVFWLKEHISVCIHRAERRQDSSSPPCPTPAACCPPPQGRPPAATRGQVIPAQADGPRQNHHLKIKSYKIRKDQDTELT